MPLTLTSTAALLAALEVLFITSIGVAVSSDSVVYLDSARHLAAGDGYLAISPGGGSAPVTHFPPLYPLVLAALIRLGLPALLAARILAVLSFSALAFSLGITVNRTAGSHAAVGGSVAAALAVLGGPLLLVAGFAWTEIPALVLLIWTIYCLSNALAGDFKSLLAGAAVAGAGALLRYTGVVAIGLGFSVLLVRRGWPWRVRLLRAGTWALVSCIPMTAFLLRNHQLAGTLTNRQLAWHPMNSGHVLDAASTLSQWLIPAQYPVIFRVSVCVIAAVAVIASVSRDRRAELKAAGKRLIAEGLWVGFALAYLMFLVASISLMDQATSPDTRILSPVLLAGYALLGYSALSWQARQVSRGRTITESVLFIVCLCGLLFMRTTAQVPEILDRHIHGDGYLTAKRDIPPSILRLISTTPAVIYSNDYLGLYWLGGRSVVRLPVLADANSGLANVSLPEQEHLLQRRLIRGALVVILRGQERPTMPIERVRGLVPLHVLHSDSLVQIYTASPTTILPGGKQ